MMKKTITLLAVLLAAIITVTACGSKKSDTKQAANTSKSKVSKSVSKPKTSSSSSSEMTSSSATSEVSEDGHLHGEAEESHWSEESSEAAKIMTVSEARQALREINIDDSNFSNADLNGYILDAQKAGQDFKTYMSAQGFAPLN